MLLSPILGTILGTKSPMEAWCSLRFILPRPPPIREIRELDGGSLIPGHADPDDSKRVIQRLIPDAEARRPLIGKSS